MKVHLTRFNALNAAVVYLCSSKARPCAEERAVAEVTAAAVRCAIFS